MTALVLDWMPVDWLDMIYLILQLNKIYKILMKSLDQLVHKVLKVNVVMSVWLDLKDQKVMTEQMVQTEKLEQ